MQNEVADSPPGDATLTEDLDRFKEEGYFHYYMGFYMGFAFN